MKLFWRRIICWFCGHKYSYADFHYMDVIYCKSCLQPLFSIIVVMPSFKPPAPSVFPPQVH